jgi:hypothetical protein
MITTTCSILWMPSPPSGEGEAAGRAEGTVLETAVGVDGVFDVPLHAARAQVRTVRASVTGFERIGRCTDGQSILDPRGGLVGSMNHR